jgi:hypothetical protein
VGQSLLGEGRLSGHVRAAINGGKYPIHYWIRKLLLLGLEPLWELQEEVLEEEDWAGVEQWYIAAYRAAGCKLLNCTDGGEGVIGHKHTEEAKAKISKGCTGLKMSEDAKKRISEALTGRDVSEETRQNMREAWKTRPPDTPETCAKKSAARTGTVRSDTTKAKMSASLTGKVRTEETKGRMREAWKTRDPGPRDEYGRYIKGENVSETKAPVRDSHGRFVKKEVQL